jgi:hypothetical protein
MPMPVIIQPMMIAPGNAPRDMSEGRLKTPPPIINSSERYQRERVRVLVCYQILINNNSHGIHLVFVEVSYQVNLEPRKSRAIAAVTQIMADSLIVGFIFSVRPRLERCTY